MIRKVRTNYEELTQAELEEFLVEMILSMTGNASFPTPTVPIADIVLQKKDWNEKLNLSKKGNHAATSEANILQAKICRSIKVDGDYVNNTANGNVSMLESSGYWMVKLPVYQPKPDIKAVQGTQLGSVTIVIEAIPDAVTYLVEIAADPLPEPGNTSLWAMHKMSTKSKIPFSGLEARKLYWMRFCYLTAVDGESPCSQPVSFSLV
ncbi:MAG: hypothetical protein WCL06_15575 [Bacteroidota bacterium]